MQFITLLAKDRRGVFLNEVEAVMNDIDPPRDQSAHISGLHSFWLKARHDWFKQVRGLIDR